MQLPPFIPILAAFVLSLFICVCLHLFIRSRSLMRPKSSGPSRSEDMDPSNCATLIRNQITLVQTFSHPTPAGRQQVEQLVQMLMGAGLYFPAEKEQLISFAGRFQKVYEDDGLFLMALMDLRKWLGSHLQTPGAA